jgi:hypothetical protein
MKTILKVIVKITVSVLFFSVFSPVVFSEVPDVDTDKDGIPDSKELSGYKVKSTEWVNGQYTTWSHICKTDPNKYDTDNDGIGDGDEVKGISVSLNVNGKDEVHTYVLDPTDYDSDNDGIKDGDEILGNTTIVILGKSYCLKNKTDPVKIDTDGDGIQDGNEVQFGYNPVNQDTDNDGMPDKWEALNKLNPKINDTERDNDVDGLTNIDEYKHKTNPRNPDTDGDGMSDGWEVNNGLDPLLDDTQSDLDNDGLKNIDEYNNKTNPSNPDTDNDGISDGNEVKGFVLNATVWRNGAYGAWKYVCKTDPNKYDTDNDGLSDGAEAKGIPVTLEVNNTVASHVYILDPSDSDSDNDGINDGDEILGKGTTVVLGKSYIFPYKTDPVKIDTDGDGIQDGNEVQFGYNPVNQDTDNDGMPDKWEAINKLNPKNKDDANLDPDKDGITNLQEYKNGTDPHKSDLVIVKDSDNDGLSDDDEINKYNTDPNNPDTDRDSLIDGDEVNKYHTCPYNKDTDGDTLRDDTEINATHTDPTKSDTDNDGMPDGWEVKYGLNPLTNDAQYDKDGDKVTNINEYLNASNPLKPDTDTDGMPDAWEIKYDLDPARNDANLNPDSDGLTNIDEYNNKTDPRNPDTDGDGMPDGWEVTNGLDPLVKDAQFDPDKDGLTNIEEYEHRTDPMNKDTDGDGMPDGWEVKHKLSPFIVAPDVNDAYLDGDDDVLTNIEEYYLGTDPNNNDTDGDEIVDGYDTDTIAKWDTLSEETKNIIRKCAESADEALWGYNTGEINYSGLNISQIVPKRAVRNEDSRPNYHPALDKDNDGVMDSIQNTQINPQFKYRPIPVAGQWCVDIDWSFSYDIQKKLIEEGNHMLMSLWLYSNNSYWGGIECETFTKIQAKVSDWDYVKTKFIENGWGELVDDDTIRLIVHLTEVKDSMSIKDSIKNVFYNDNKGDDYDHLIVCLQTGKKDTYRDIYTEYAGIMNTLLNPYKLPFNFISANYESDMSKVCNVEWQKKDGKTVYYVSSASKDQFYHQAEAEDIIPITLENCPFAIENSTIQDDNSDKICFEERYPILSPYGDIKLWEMIGERWATGKYRNRHIPNPWNSSLPDTQVEPNPQVETNAKEEVDGKYSLKYFSEIYPNPPMIHFMSNNEAGRATALDIGSGNDGDAREKYDGERYSKDTEIDEDEYSNEKRMHILKKLSLLFKAMLKPIKDKVKNDYWPDSKISFEAYKAVDPQFIGMKPCALHGDGKPILWFEYTSENSFESTGDDFSYLMHSSTEDDNWEGGLESEYVAWFHDDYSAYSLQLRFMNAVFLTRHLLEKNPSFRYSIKPMYPYWPYELNDKYIATETKDYDFPKRYLGMVQFLIWMQTPRNVVEDGSCRDYTTRNSGSYTDCTAGLKRGNPENGIPLVQVMREDGKTPISFLDMYKEGVLEAVNRIHKYKVLREFMRTSEIVDTTEVYEKIKFDGKTKETIHYVNPYSDGVTGKNSISLPYADEKRWFLLKAKYNTDTIGDASDNWLDDCKAVQIPVLSIARVRTLSNGAKQWLVYAHAPCGDKGKIIVSTKPKNDPSTWATDLDGDGIAYDTILNNAELTIPSAGKIKVDVPMEGAFYIVDENVYEGNYLKATKLNIE